ncbi:PGG domain [Dillenia turbinata]|uniref:PGG domain n=1 Tax=Dillenia turbinata TaxID=194707 RepID=A0AAN8YYB1_9MAGN
MLMARLLFSSHQDKDIMRWSELLFDAAKGCDRPEQDHHHQKVRETGGGAILAMRRRRSKWEQHFLLKLGPTALPAFNNPMELDVAIEHKDNFVFLSMEDDVKSRRRVSKEVGGRNEGEHDVKTLMEPSTCDLVVAALIATVTFAAGFTLLSVLYSDPDYLPGTPILVKKAASRAFCYNECSGQCSFCPCSFHLLHLAHA